MVDYELAIKSLKTKAKKVLMAADESQLDEHGVAKAYSSWKLLPTEENKARVLAKHPQTKFLNDELDSWRSSRSLASNQPFKMKKAP